jgi:hypothetical protein
MEIAGTAGWSFSFSPDLEAKGAMMSGDVGTKALDAAQQFGKIVNHPAKLNMGDCFTYACASAYRTRIAYKGNDFAETDLGWRRPMRARRSKDEIHFLRRQNSAGFENVSCHIRQLLIGFTHTLWAVTEDRLSALHFFPYQSVVRRMNRVRRRTEGRDMLVDQLLKACLRGMLAGKRIVRAITG